MRDDKDGVIARSGKGFEMANQREVTVSDTARGANPDVIEADGLTAEYSTGCTPTGEWFALGTIVREGTLKAMPAWVVVGTGNTADEALHSLTAEISAQARNMIRS